MFTKAGQPHRGPSPAVVQVSSLLFARQIIKGAEGLPWIETLLKERPFSQGHGEGVSLVALGAIANSRFCLKSCTFWLG